VLSEIAREFADEIALHDWSDAPWRPDRAGHHYSDDDGSPKQTEQLDPEHADNIRTNVMWVTAQVLISHDPQLDLYEYAVACGVPERLIHGQDGARSGIVPNGIRRGADGTPAAPGSRA